MVHWNRRDHHIWQGDKEIHDLKAAQAKAALRKERNERLCFDVCLYDKRPASYRIEGLHGPIYMPRKHTVIISERIIDGYSIATIVIPKWLAIKKGFIKGVVHDALTPQPESTCT